MTLKQRYFLLTLFLSFSTFIYSAQVRIKKAPKLSELNYFGAAVLPIVKFKSLTTNQVAKYYLLSRERSGIYKGQWDSFGGKRNFGEHHPLVTAAREMHEETEEALFKSTKEAIEYIDIQDNDKTERIIVNPDGKGILYLAQFNNDHLKKFEVAFLNSKNFKACTSEKDQLAFVRVDVFEKAVADAYDPIKDKFNFPIKVSGRIVSLENKQLKLSKPVLLPLRNYIVKTLGPSIIGKKPLKGQDKKGRILFY